MLTLRVHLDQLEFLEPRKMHAGCRWTDFGNYSELGTGARVSVQQAIQHTGARRFADRSGNSRYLRVQMFDIHTFMLGEVLMSRKRRRSPTACEGALLYFCVGYDRMVCTLQMGGKLSAIQITFEYKELPCFIMPSCSWSLP